MSGPLHGLRVADLTHFMAGPVCTSLLRDLGAEVIKVEPLNGEAGRYGGAYPTPYGESLTFQVHNRGKMSMTVDLKTEEGKALFRDLIRISDACVENFRPGVMDRLGIGYEDLRSSTRRSCWRRSPASARSGRTHNSRASTSSRRR